MLPLGAPIFHSSVSGGTFLLLVVAAQSMRALPLLHVGMAWPHSLREGATFLVALVFLYALNRAVSAAEQARLSAGRGEPAAARLRRPARGAQSHAKCPLARALAK